MYAECLTRRLSSVSRLFPFQEFTARTQKVPKNSIKKMADKELSAIKNRIIITITTQATRLSDAILRIHLLLAGNDH